MGGEDTQKNKNRAFGTLYGKDGCTALGPLQIAKVEFLADVPGLYRVLTPFRRIIFIKSSKQNWGDGGHF